MSLSLNVLNTRLKRSRLYPLVLLEQRFPHRTRHAVYGFVVMLTAVLISIVLIGIALRTWVTYADDTPIAAMTPYAARLAELISASLPRLVGLAFLFTALALIIYVLEAYYRSLYFKEKELDLTLEDHVNDENLFSFQVLRILARANNGDITGAFLTSQQGRQILNRCGIDDAAIQNFMVQRTVTLTDLPSIDDYRIFTLLDLVRYIYEHDEDFSEFLFTSGVLEKDLFGATKWVIRANEEEKMKERWWSRENLQKIGGLGADFAYGEAYLLQRYSTEIYASSRKKTFRFASEKNREQIAELVSILSRSRESNVILVSEEGAGKMSLLYAFAADIYHGKVPAHLEGKRVMLFNTTSLMSTSPTKDELERTLVRILDDAVRAGNIILVIDDLPGFISSAGMLGTDVIKVMLPYFDSDSIHIIALSDVESYHRTLATNQQIMGKFEVLLVKEPDFDETVMILQRVAKEIERRYGVIFTYRAIDTLVRGVRNYFQNPVMPDKAIDLAVELPVRAKMRGSNIIDKRDVLELITAKTNIPTGEIGEEERDTLTRLEELLHERVIGQDKAVRAVASALRRARSGVRSMKRPIGSFLFIGPTGVGKTETAKTLARVFFGSESKLQRIDMSEYRGPDALERFIGSSRTGQVGTLTKLVTENPYGVLLLDEFEKTNPDIHDLFLQILDEGFYSDMRGKRVNVRNIIFIATSNAGSDKIWEYLEQGKNLETADREIIDYLIQTGQFRPEFLNRFDSVVLYHPLEEHHIRQIARIMLENLRKRLRRRGYDVQFDDELVAYVARRGYDRMFGARPMVRYIQDHVEQVIADKIVRGLLTPGSHYRLTPDDLEERNLSAHVSANGTQSADYRSTGGMESSQVDTVPDSVASHHVPERSVPPEELPS